MWDPYTKENQDKLEMAQRKGARYVCNDYSRESSVMAMIYQVDWHSFQQRRADIRLVLFYKILHGLVALDFSQELIPVTTTSRHPHPTQLLPTTFRNKAVHTTELPTPDHHPVEQPTSQCCCGHPS